MDFEFFKVVWVVCLSTTSHNYVVIMMEGLTFHFCVVSRGWSIAYLSTFISVAS